MGGATAHALARGERKTANGTADAGSTADASTADASTTDASTTDASTTDASTTDARDDRTDARHGPRDPAPSQASAPAREPARAPGPRQDNDVHAQIGRQLGLFLRRADRLHADLRLDRPGLDLERAAYLLLGRIVAGGPARLSTLADDLA